jgi:hypothetical protein
MIHAVLRKVLDLSENEDLQPGKPLPFTEWEAKFLIGLSFRKDWVISSSKLKIVRTLSDSKPAGDAAKIFRPP